MKKKNIIIAILLGGLFFSCGGETPADEQEETTQEENLIESDSLKSNDNQDEIERASKLPISSDIELFQKPYTVDEVLAETNSQIDNSQQLKVVISEDGELILGIYSFEEVAEESFLLDIGYFNDFNIEVKLEWTDANQDEIEDELVIWWNTMDGRNGFMDGYETERNGIIIYNVTNRFAMLNFCYSAFDANYSAGENADTENENFHAKMDDNSIWEICSYYQDIKLSNGNLILSNSGSETENTEVCIINLVVEGTYAFNNASGQFEIVK